ncbi:uroporphyrinogen decarboxylase family protein [Niveispirillum fermenti]|uniref:uroporphyrinogen decarboxylase family protein n=1 Tax=Niveispirillum fermenti TaxID=1233113 RepID=UPI003A870D46
MTILPRHGELLGLVLAGTPAPICPVFAHHHHPAADQDAGMLADATLAWQARFDLDLVKLTPASTWQLRDYGVEDAPDPADALGRRRITRTIVETMSDWGRLPLLNPGGGFAARIVAATRLIRRRLPAGIPLLTTLYGPASLAVKLAPPGMFDRHRHADPNAVAQGLAILTENCRRLVTALADAGADGIFLAVQTARKPLFTADDYASLCLSGDLACLAAASALPFNILHLHGDGIHHELFATARQALLHYDPSPGNPAPESLLASRGSLSTGPRPDGAITHGTAARCTDEVAGLLARLKGPGFVLAPGCSLPLSVPAANLDMLVQMARTPRHDRP